jgi:hypothetical protein
MVNTPGILAWAINGYKFKKDRKAMRRVLAEGYDLTDKVADGLLSGKIPHRIEGDEVVFEVEGNYRRTPVVV